MTCWCLGLLLLLAPLGPPAPGGAAVSVTGTASAVAEPERAVAGEPLTLGAAVAEALAQGLAAAAARQARDDALAAAGLWRPRLQPQVTATARTELAPAIRDPAAPHAIVRRDWSARADLTVEQVLLGFGSGALRAHGRAAEAAAEADYQAALASVRREVTAAWLDLALAQEGLALAREGEALAAAQVARVAALVTVERVAEVDRLQADAGQLEAEAGRVEAEHGLRLAAANLNRLLGRQQDAPVAVVAPQALPQPPADLAVGLARARAQRPEAVALAARQVEAGSGAQLAGARGGPTVSAVAGVSVGTPAAFERAADARIGLVARWQPFSADLQARREVLEARAGERAAALGLEQMRAGHELEVRAAWYGLADARARFALAEGRVAALAEAHRVKQLQYDRQRVTLLDVEQTRLELQRAALDRTRALLDAHRALAEWRWATAE